MQLPLPPRSHTRRSRGPSNSSSSSTTAASDPNQFAQYVVIGGGIAGVSCAQEIVRHRRVPVLLVSATDTLKESKSISRITQYIEDIAIFEKQLDNFVVENPLITVVKGKVSFVDVTKKILYLSDSRAISFYKLCVCSGARPRLIDVRAAAPLGCSNSNSSSSSNNSSNNSNNNGSSHSSTTSSLSSSNIADVIGNDDKKGSISAHSIIGLRDLDSVKVLAEQVNKNGTVVIIGNGGIALELVDLLKETTIHWIIKDHYIGSVFFDATASEFIMPQLSGRKNELNETPHVDNSSSSSISNVSSSTISKSNVTGSSIADGGDGGNSANKKLKPSPYNYCSSSSSSSSSSSDNSNSSNSNSSQVVEGVDNSVDDIRQYCGAALGPEWVLRSNFNEFLSKASRNKSALHIHYKQHAVSVCEDGTWFNVLGSSFDETAATTSGEEGSNSNHSLDDMEERMQRNRNEFTFANDLSGKCIKVVTNKNVVIGCDVIISATGVVSDTDFLDGGSSGISSSSSSLLRTEAKEIIVDRYMQTSHSDIYAAGDCCFVDSKIDWRKLEAGVKATLGSSSTLDGADDSKEDSEDKDNDEESGEEESLWFQMKLWSQARIMGVLAAQNMINSSINSCLPDLFTHTTRFFSHRVILLGKFNHGDNSEALVKTSAIESGVTTIAGNERDGCQVWVRVSKKEYIRLVVKTAYYSEAEARSLLLSKIAEIDSSIEDCFASQSSAGRRVGAAKGTFSHISSGLVKHQTIIGAVLVGDTGLEEVFENLILSRREVSEFGMMLLDPDIDIEDFFD